MRLKQIKLSGFKSFVDPTTFQVPSQLVGVVGPNGCGKSNVIDAVRWVLGESKASELRGESMQDVIFNGSSDRKPSARASVELIFDNSLGRIGGNWAQYAEISVRRVLSRDNQSVYQINGQTVRRRDVYDMFLGTGLGPRAYAIIGQGTISRLIEAKPEELRIYLEEAAGVSKYKERRRETESRLSATRENLSRVDDITQELEGQIARLSRQAEVAKNFRELDLTRTRVQRMQWIMRRDDARAAKERCERLAAEATNALEAKTTELRRVEADIENHRQHVEKTGAEVHQMQASFYESNAEVARLEAEIRRVSEARDLALARGGQLAAQIDALAQRQLELGQRDDVDHHELAQEIGREDSAAQDVDLRRRELEVAEQALRECLGLLDSAKAKSTEVRHVGERLALEASAIDEALANHKSRLDRDQQQQAALSTVDVDELHAARQRAESLGEQERAAEQAQHQAQEAWAGVDQQRVPAQEALREAQAAHAQVSAREQALRDLQDRLARQDKLLPWLASHGMDESAPLWERVRVDSGWETAIEAVLRERVSARQSGSLSEALALIDRSPPSKVTVFASVHGAAQQPHITSGLTPLVSRVRSGEPVVQASLERWLQGCYAADSVQYADRHLEHLGDNECFVLPNGHRVGRNEIMLYAPDSERDGVLQRQQELENLARDLRAKQLILEQSREQATKTETEASRLAQTLERARAEHRRVSKLAAEAKLSAQSIGQKAERAQAEMTRLSAAIEDTQAQIRSLTARRENVTSQVDAMAEQASPLSEALSQAHAKRDAAEQSVSLARETLRKAEHDAQAVVHRRQVLESRIQQTEADRAEARRRHDEAEAERTQVTARLAGLDLTPLEGTLQDALALQSQAEQALTAARQRASEAADTLRQADTSRMQLEADREPLLQRCTEMQLKEQAARLSIEQYQEQLSAAGVSEADEAAVTESFEQPPALSWLQSELSRLGKVIDGLGPVNMAAIDELDESKERKAFLDEQAADLNDAIATLEDAIQKIDLETRALLQETFDTVNGHFGRLFPEVFGGGDAKLELTGDEILDSGVQVMAHPPGKRNASIHLLSGGEKALTAIALVFALFQLNPAPFCLLDEVDAPLDDANTERYRAMVQRMSAQTQFLFITHNKIAMEMAQQLIGVTMQERGVSRIVAVDLDSAAEMAQAA